MRENLVETKSQEFAVRIIRLYQFLMEEKHEYILSKQLVRAGTSIGANVREAVHGFSRRDFAFKMSIALKECNETCYWLELLEATDYISGAAYDSIYADATALLKILTSIVKTTKNSTDMEQP